MIRKQKDQGFTLVEMLLAMIFVAFLMLTIALTTIGMAHTYQRGMTLASINTVGRSIITDVRRTITNSPIRAGSAADSMEYRQGSIVRGGAVCFGNFSYIWNLGDTVATGSGAVKYSDGSVVRLAKVTDPAGAYCQKQPDADELVLGRNASELLSDGATGDSAAGIALQRPITVKNGPSGETQALYTVAFQLGTNDKSARNDDGTCKPPSDANGNLDYCAVSEFSFLVRAGGGQQ